MLPTPTTTSPVTPAPAYPTRFREGEARGARMARPLRVLGRVRTVDERLMDRIGRAMTERDELGGRLADAIRMRAGEPGKVTLRQLRTALHDGLDAVPDAPPALVDFVARNTEVPDWVDWDLVEEGARVYNRLGQNAADVLLQLSLVGGYRFGGPTDLLVATGGLTGGMTRRRLAETQKWAVTLGQPDALRPGGEAWRLTLHVRAMHALVNAELAETWDTGRWGPPINQADLASTLGLFDGVLLIGARALGARITRAESRAVMHQWKWIGHLMGVDEDFLVDREGDRHRITYHVVRAQADITDAGPRLAQAVVEAQSERTYPGWPPALRPLRARWEKERLLSMLTVFLGPTSMRELGLPMRPPWAHAYIVALNLWRYGVLARTDRGRQRLDRWGERVSRRILDSYFGEEAEDVGELRA